MNFSRERPKPKEKPFKVFFHKTTGKLNKMKEIVFGVKNNKTSNIVRVMIFIIQDESLSKRFHLSPQ